MIELCGTARDFDKPLAIKGNGPVSAYKFSNGERYAVFTAITNGAGCARHRFRWLRFKSIT
jgi:hypothetical protein